MPNKRDRPQSLDGEGNSTDAAALRRRQLTAERTRRYRERLRVAGTSVRPPTQEQLQQGEQIISLAFTEQDAAETLTQLGLRVQGVTLAQDTGAAHVQQGAIAVNKHDQLYRATNTRRAINRSPPPPPVERPRLDQGPSGPVAPPASRDPAQSSLSRFFHTRPAPNPLASTASKQPTGQQRVRPSSPAPPLPFNNRAPVFLGDEDNRPFNTEFSPDTEDRRPPNEQDDGDDEHNDEHDDEHNDEHNGEHDDGQDGDDEHDDEHGGEHDTGTGEEPHAQDDEAGQEAALNSAPLSDQSTVSDQHSDADSPPFNFASEHSDDEDSSDEDEISAHNYTVQKLLD